MKKTNDEMSLLLTESEGCRRYRLGRNTFRRFAMDCGAYVRIAPRIVRYRKDVMDSVIADMSRDQRNLPRA